MRLSFFADSSLTQQFGFGAIVKIGKVKKSARASFAFWWAFYAVASRSRQ